MKQLITGVLLFFICSSAMAEYCAFAREEVSGNSKFCFYSCIKGDQVITIDSIRPCPVMREFAASTYDDPTVAKLLLVSVKDIGEKHYASCNPK